MGDIADAPHETAGRRRTARERVVRLWLAGGVRLAGRSELKQAAHTRERLVVLVALGKEAVVTDAMEAVGQDVEEKATDELVARANRMTRGRGGRGDNRIGDAT